MCRKSTHIYIGMLGVRKMRKGMSKQKKAARKDSTALWVVIVVIIAIISGGVFAGYKITKS